MDSYIEKIRALLNELENEKNVSTQLEIVDELCEISCDFYNKTLGEHEQMKGENV